LQHAPEGLSKVHEKPQPQGLQELGGQDSHILRLPAELRNRIYFEVMVSPTPIAIDEENHSHPGLLQTSRQLRREAIKIYEENNSFRVDLEDLKFAPQPSHWVWHSYVEFSSNDTMSFDSCWPNLVEWLRLYHAGHTDITLTLDSLDVPLHRVMDFDLDALFTMVNTMRECSWVPVAKVVAAWQCAVEEAFYTV